MTFEVIHAADAATKTVVQNDTANMFKRTSSASAICNALEQLMLEREQWEDNAYRTSNEQLYALLQRCYQLYKSMEGSSKMAAAMRKELDDYCGVKGYRFLKTTHSLTKIVKCVFGDTRIERRRVSTYSLVLRAALQKEVKPTQVADFIRNSGGIEEIRLAKSPTAISPKEKAKRIVSTVAARELGRLEGEALKALFNDAGKIDTNTVLIGTWQADGSIVVRAVVESDTVLTAALASYYSANKDEVKVATEQQIEQDAQAEVRKAIEEAVAAAELVA